MADYLRPCHISSALAKNIEDSSRHAIIIEITNMPWQGSDRPAEVHKITINYSQSVLTTFKYAIIFRNRNLVRPSVQMNPRKNFSSSLAVVVEDGQGSKNAYIFSQRLCFFAYWNNIEINFTNGTYTNKSGGGDYPLEGKSWFLFVRFEDFRTWFFVCLLESASIVSLIAQAWINKQTVMRVRERERGWWCLKLKVEQQLVWFAWDLLLLSW